MITHSLRLLLIAIMLSPFAVSAAGLPPWQFGMTPAEVRGVKEFGPYKAFSNGDLETFNGRFKGRKQNVQFFFQNGRLRRIGIYLWEGRDPKKGIPVWQRAYGLLQADYGRVATPDLKATPGSEPLNAEVLAIAAAVHADVTGRTEMVPAKQPREMRVSAAFMAYMAREGKSYAIAIFLDPKA
ncbi:MAG: hypothetical protein M3Q86_14040 [Verrucomicrobiota bacterium]|nr:hypothetical protein [Verrucomicrobiota bacterium]